MRAVLNDNEIYVFGCNNILLIKSIPGRRWNRYKKCWILPLSIESIEKIKDLPGAFDPDILTEYYKLIERKRKTEAERFGSNEPIEPMPIRIKPYQHQVRAYNMALMNQGFGFLMEMGCGKSLTAVAVAGRRFERGEVNRLLIIAPTSVVPVWPKEFEAATIKCEVKVLAGPVSKRIDMLKAFQGSGLQVAVINYESTWRMLGELLDWGPEMVIADESQRIKNAGAAQSKAVHALGRLAHYRLILTGTPVQNSPLDTFSQWKFLDESIFGTSFTAFRARYADMQYIEMGQRAFHKVVGFKNLDELIRKAHSIAYRVTKQEALDLPDTVDVNRWCELEPKAKRIYEEVRQESCTELQRGDVTVTNVLTKLLRLQQITGGFINTDDGVEEQVSSAKMKVLEEIIEDVVVDAGKKIVIFARFIPEIQAIWRIADRLKVESAVIYGAVKDRGEQVRRFQEDVNCKVFIAQIQTAGLGITLTAADTAVFFSVDFNYANYSQARARIHRLGQKNACTYIHIMAQHTIDAKVMDALCSKQDMARAVVDNWRAYFSK